MGAKKNSLIENRGGQLTFALVLIACIAFSLVSVALESGQKAEIDEVSGITAKVRGGLESNRVAILPPKARDAAGEKAQWESVPEIKAPQAWIFARRPAVRVEVEKKEDPRKVLSPPGSLSARQKDYSVTLTWQDSKDSTAKTTGYNVYRWVAGQADKPEKPVNDRPLGVEDKTFTDTDFDVLKPLAELFYAVEATTDEETRSGRKASGLSEPVSIRLPDDRKVLFYGKMAVEFAYVTVQRFHGGEYIAHDFMTYLGETIGKPVPKEIDDKKLQIDFTSDFILAYIGKEIKNTEETYKEQLRDEKGALQFTDDGKPIEVEKKRTRIQTLMYILASDRNGNVVRIDETEPPKPVLAKPDELDPAKSNAVDLRINRLEIRLFEAKSANEPWTIRKRLQKRIAFLKEKRSKLLNPKTGAVDEERIFKKGEGLLFELRWEYLAADRKAKKSKTEKNVEDALLLDEIIKDLESFLSPEGVQKEQEEWNIDKEEFREKYKDDKEEKEERKKD